MDSLTSGTPAQNPTNNPTNNPRLDLLHGTGVNSQINSQATNTYASTAFHAAPMAAAAGAAAGAAGAAAAKPEYVKAAKTKPAETTPPPKAPQQQPIAPEPRPIPNAPEPPKRRWPLIVGIILFVLFIIGAVVGWWILSQQPKQEDKVATTKEVEVANPTNLRQLTEDGEEVTAGSTTSKTNLTFRFVVPTDANAGSLTPEVELRPLDTPFTGEPTATGEAVTANGGNLEFSVAASALANGSYHWQARVSKGDQSSEWVLYGTVDAADADQAAKPSFIIDTTSAATPKPAAQPLTVETVSGVAVGSPTTVTTNKPTFAGKAAAGTTITLKISSDSIEQTTKANDQGAWNLALNKELANGTYQVALTDSSGGQTQVSVQVNQPTAAATPAPAPAATPAPAQASIPEPQPEKLAATGDNTLIITFASFLALVFAAIGLVWNRRRYAVR